MVFCYNPYYNSKKDNKYMPFTDRAPASEQKERFARSREYFRRLGEAASFFVEDLEGGFVNFQGYFGRASKGHAPAPTPADMEDHRSSDSPMGGVERGSFRSLTEIVDAEAPVDSSLVSRSSLFAPKREGGAVERAVRGFALSNLNQAPIQQQRRPEVSVIPDHLHYGSHGPAAQRMIGGVVDYFESRSGDDGASITGPQELGENAILPKDVPKWRG